MHLIDHTEPNWLLRYQSNKRENGAATYSRELVKYQVPIWRDNFSGSLLISTCGLLHYQDNLPKSVDLVVQYLHTIKYDDYTKEAVKVIENLRTKYKRIVFVTAYQQVCDGLNAKGIDAIFIPMTIDTASLPRSIADDDKRVIYFGNVTHVKNNMFRTLRQTFRKRGWQFDHLSDSTFNGEYLETQEQVWSVVSQYRYGVGVGRCALEMFGMNMKVLVAGIHNTGGLILDDDDYEVQQRTNFNGLNNKYNLKYAIDNFENSIIRTNDIHQMLPEIERIISAYI